jgi:hypothetical protein
VDNHKREGGMTEQELQAIEQRANGATAGPWKAEMGQVLYWSPRPTKAKPNAGYTHTLIRAEQTDYASGEFFAVVDDTDATFIAHARTDVPALVAEVRRLRALVEALERGQGQAIQDALDLDADARWEL